MKGLTVGFAFCGSFCTLHKALDALERVKESGAEVLPIMSETTYGTDTRFGTAQSFRTRMEEICGREIVHTLPQAEPIGPKKLLDLLIVAPCTGNTLGKLANGITDSAVTLAAKAHLRNERPLLLAVSTNDALAASAENIGKLLRARHIYFVPMRQDDPQGKHTSVVADFTQILPAAECALRGEQIQPVLLGSAEQ